jgi:hypothetical protein
MTNEIFIENKQVDISEGLSNLITYAIDDVKDIGSRNTSFSKTIILPGTANNNTRFGHIFDVTISNPYDVTQSNTGINFNASVQANCIIYQNHIQVFKGIFRILEINIIDGIPEYECAVFGELGGLINSIANRKIEELDFSAYDHILSIPNVTGSWDTFNGSGYFYPLADYGNVSINKVDYDISALRPGLAVREYLQKIFAQAGYRYSAPLFETPRFKSLIIPNGQKGFQKLSSVLLYVYTTSGYNVTTSSGPSPPQNIKFDTLAVLGSFVASAANSIFTNGGSDTLNTFFNIELNFTLEGQGYVFKFKLLKNGAPIFDFGDVGTSGALPINFSQVFADIPVSVAPGDAFSIEVNVTSAGGIGPWYAFCNESIWSINTTNAVYIDINPGDTITINDTIPRNVLQRDFLSSVLRLFNLYVTEDNLQSKYLVITPFPDFYNASGIVDWTYKLDYSKPQKITPMSELNNRFYDFTYKGDSDYYNDLYQKRYGQNYGDYLFDSEFFFSPDKGEIPLIFAGTPMVGYSGVDKIVSTYYKQDGGGVETQQASVIRILQTKKITGVASWIIYNGVTPLATLTNYGYAGHYDDPDAPANDLNFGVPKEIFFTLVTGAINVTQFNVYWSSYMAEITDKDSKLLTAHFKLTNSDIYNLDFGTFIYVDGSYFRLNKIIDWNSNEPDVCVVELLKVIYQTY